MKKRPRVHYNDRQKGQMWKHWKNGNSLHRIVQPFDRNQSSVQRILAETGGIRPASVAAQNGR